MLDVDKSIKGVWDRHYDKDSQYFQRSFAYCLIVLAPKVSNDLDKYIFAKA